MLILARAIVVASFLGGAFLASLDETKVNWVLFVPAVLAGIVGVVLLKRSERAAAQDSEVLASDREALETSLGNILANLAELDGRKERVPTYEMRFEIDRVFREDLATFAAARDSMKHLFGLMAYADIMSSFAAGERYLNRVWSASTDGYVDEVLLYVGKAHDQFQHARQEWDKAASA